MEDFSFYSEIFCEATSEASNTFGGLLCNEKKMFRATQKLSVGFQLFKV